MEFLRNLLGIKKLENETKTQETEIRQLRKTQKSTITSQNKLLKSLRTQKSKIKQLEKAKEATTPLQDKLLRLLRTPKSTTQAAKSLNVSRSYITTIINQLESKGKLVVHSKQSRTILYKTK